MTVATTLIRPARPDISGTQRTALASAATLMGAWVAYALVRWLAGWAPATPWVHRPALAIHLFCVLPALPLGAYVLLARKGGARHRWLGRLWIVLMLAGAGASLFLQNLNPGSFSPVHLFSLMTFLSVPRAILAARRGDIAAHRRQMLTLYVAGLLVAGLFAFLPGRTMWQWTFGAPAMPLAPHG